MNFITQKDFAVDYLLDNIDTLQKPTDLMSNLPKHIQALTQQLGDYFNQPNILEEVKDFIKPEHKRELRYMQTRGYKNADFNTWKFSSNNILFAEVRILNPNKVLFYQKPQNFSKTHRLILNQKVAEEGTYNQLIKLTKVIIHQIIKVLVYDFFTDNYKQHYAEEYYKDESELLKYCLAVTSVKALPKSFYEKDLPELHVYKCPECHEHEVSRTIQEQGFYSYCSYHNLPLTYYRFVPKNYNPKDFE